MNFVSVKDLTHSESGRELFRDITFGIDDTSKIALIGRNGSGKTTLLRLAAGLKEPEEGEISRNRNLKCAFLEQTPVFNRNERIADFILSGDSEEIALIREYETITGAMDGCDNNQTARLSEVMAGMERLDCWSLENRIHSLLTELGISDLSLEMRTLSGGMIKKAALARTLVIDANLIILDEPTNHLDIETINWLENFLINCGKALLLVTHDRYFMDSICSSIFEIEDGGLYSYQGNYSAYLEIKSLRESSQAKTADRINNILRNEAEWIKRGPRARAGKDKKRKERFFDLVEKRQKDKASSDSFSVTGKRLGGKILELEGISKAYSEMKLVDNFTYSFQKGDRLGIVGPNGSGKTTLLNIISGRIEPDSGRVDPGVNTKIGYYDQLSAELPGNERAIDYIKETAEVITLKDGSTVSPAQFLERFMFSKSLQYTLISNLSGGEKKKLYLLKILLENPNFLIFDEPTNDFDLQTLSILEDFLGNFSGITVIVSHDRFFLDRTVDFLFILDGKGDVKGYAGEVTTYYSETSIQGEAEAKVKQNGSADSGPTREKKGLTYKEKKELEAIEDDIMKLEEERENLEKLFSSSEMKAEDLGPKKKRYDSLLVKIEEKYTRWGYLEAKEAKEA